MANPIQKILANFTQPVYGGIGTILMLHRICPSQTIESQSAETRALQNTAEELEQMLEYLMKHRYQILSMDGVVEMLIGKRPKKRFVAFTFDDGYRDNLNLAYPIFKKFDAPFTIYITSSFPNQTAVLWWYLLDDLINTNRIVEIELDNETRVFDTSTDNGIQQLSQAVRQFIKYSSKEEYLPRIKQVFEPFNMDIYALTRELALSWEEIERLNRDPLVTIGCHTVNHLVLSKLSDEDARKEIADNKEELETRLAQPVHHFAYPYGGSTQAGKREMQMASEMDFHSAVTTRPGNIFYAHRKHLFALPRLEINRAGGVDNLELAMKGLSTLRINKLRRVLTN
jgi:peptidoglycan/xylan/chitin deacetylase (PgdA/CDA1 family)